MPTCRSLLGLGLKSAAGTLIPSGAAGVGAARAAGAAAGVYALFGLQALRSILTSPNALSPNTAEGAAGQHINPYANQSNTDGKGFQQGTPFPQVRSRGPDAGAGQERMSGVGPEAGVRSEVVLGGEDARQGGDLGRGTLGAASIKKDSSPLDAGTVGWQRPGPNRVPDNDAEGESEVSNAGGASSEVGRDRTEGPTVTTAANPTLTNRATSLPSERDAAGGSRSYTTLARGHSPICGCGCSTCAHARIVSAICGSSRAGLCVGPRGVRRLMDSAVAMAASGGESGQEPEIDEAKEPGPEGVGWSGPAEAANRETLAGPASGYGGASGIEDVGKARDTGEDLFRRTSDEESHPKSFGFPLDAGAVGWQRPGPNHVPDNDAEGESEVSNAGGSRGYSTLVPRRVGLPVALPAVRRFASGAGEGVGRAGPEVVDAPPAPSSANDSEGGRTDERDLTDEILMDATMVGNVMLKNKLHAWPAPGAPKTRSSNQAGDMGDSPITPEGNIRGRTFPKEPMTDSPARSPVDMPPSSSFPA